MTFLPFVELYQSPTIPIDPMTPVAPGDRLSRAIAVGDGLLS